MGICRSTYYGWLSVSGSVESPSTHRLTGCEREAVVSKKKTAPHLSHRQISGYLRHEGFLISPSSCYRILRNLGWVEPQSLRQAPWTVSHYEPFRPNQIWGEDLTQLVIKNVRHLFTDHH
jgi:hypothetical protein